MKDFIAIDFETANAKRVSACSLGCAHVVNGEITESTQYLINPVGGHAPFQSKIHGIKEEHTAWEPDFKEIFPKIENLFAHPLIGYSQFDKQVLNALKQHFNIGFDFEYIDACSTAKEELPNLKNHKLKTLAKYFGLPKFKHHDAKEDAIACAKIFLNLQSIGKQSATNDMTDLGLEFQGFIRGILSDDEVNYKEAYELLYWLEDNPSLEDKYGDILALLEDVLSDDHLSKKESIEVKNILKMHLKLM